MAEDFRSTLRPTNDKFLGMIGLTDAIHESSGLCLFPPACLQLTVFATAKE
jgi:hypothetical protein